MTKINQVVFILSVVGLLVSCGEPHARSSAALTAPSAVGIARESSPFESTSAFQDIFGSCLGGSGNRACFDGSKPAPLNVIGTAADTLLSAPTNLTATINGNSVTLTWGAPTLGDPVRFYVVEAGSSAGLANLASVSTGSAVTTFFASGVPAGTYYVRVRAANDAGAGPASNEVALQVGGIPGCGPLGTPALTLVSNSGGTIVLSWTMPSGGPTAYILQAGTAPGLSNLANLDLRTASTSYTVTGVPSGTYYVRVLARRNDCARSAPSNEVVISVAPPPLAPAWIRFSTESFGIETFCVCVGGSRTVFTASVDGVVRGTRSCEDIDGFIVEVTPGTHTAAGCYTSGGAQTCWNDTFTLASGQTGTLAMTVSFCDLRDGRKP